MTEDPRLACEGLVVGHGGEALLPPIDLAIRAGELVVVVGRNGSGKTTWFRTLLGLVPPVAGRVVRPPDLRFAYVPQRAGIDEAWPLRVRDVVALGADAGRSFLWPATPRVGDALAAVGAVDLAERPYSRLSEGQKQRVLLARMVAARAQVALLDEPTAAMDAVAEREAFDLLDGLRARTGMAVVVVSHGLRRARERADRVLWLDREAGRAVCGPPHEVLSDPSFRERFDDVTGEVG